MKRYSELLEQWEQEAYHDGYGADWLAYFCWLNTLY